MLYTPSHTRRCRLGYEVLESRQMLSATQAGDYNADGLVDAADYVAWRASLNATVAVAGDGADGNHDRVIGAEDYQVWRTNFGQLPGDYNIDGRVDAADFVVWRAASSASTAGPVSAAVGNRDLSVAANDYEVWRANFGNQRSAQRVTNWFDTTIQDAALRSLGHNLYLDSLIDRSDMLALFANAQDEGAVDATEFRDMQSITANATLFGKLDYIRALTNYVVVGNPANAHYQGRELGNLTASSTAEQLRNLVNKWFLGLDRPATTYGYATASGTLFVNGATYSDVNQGNLNDCYFLASLAETALKSPATIADMFIVNGDGTYTVKFYNNGQVAYVTVDSYLPTDGTGHLTYAGGGKLYNDPANELWVSLAEKAYVQINEMGWLRGYLAGNGQNAYAAVAGGYIYAALGQITGQVTVAFNTTLVATNFNAFADAYKQGKLIGFSSVRVPTSKAVVGNHSYAVVGYDATRQSITLFNPWGIQFGLLTLTWSEIQANFSHFDRTG